MPNKIIAINSTHLIKNPIANDFMIKKNSIWQNFIKMPNLIPHSIFYSRIGANFLPFQTLTNIPNISVPKLDTTFSLTFDQITDQRFYDLQRTHNDRPWIVMWSGGIDSTVILTSILKNSSVEDRKRIIVACNRISVYEYPKFYYEYIKPNFTIIDSSNFNVTHEHLTKYYVISGDQADALYAGAFSQDMLLSSPDDFNRNFKTDPDRLIKFITEKTDSKFADWFYQSILTNINSVDIPIKTYHDFFWWMQFNLTWVSDKLRQIEHETIDVNLIKLYFDNFTAWFDTDQYQQWAMNNNSVGMKYGSELSQYKFVAKNYIYNFNLDRYYHKFKIYQFIKITFQNEFLN
jgi:hypothetical protein